MHNPTGLTLMPDGTLMAPSGVNILREHVTRINELVSALRKDGIFVEFTTRSIRGVSDARDVELLETNIVKAL